MNHPMLTSCKNLGACRVAIRGMSAMVHGDAAPVSLKAAFKDHFMMGVALN